MTKRKTKAPKSAEAGAASAALHSSDPGDEPPQNPGGAEPTAVLFGLWREVGAGWQWVRCDVPRSVVEQYATKVSTPDMRGVAVGQVVGELERFAFGGGE